MNELSLRTEILETSNLNSSYSPRAANIAHAQTAEQSEDRCKAPIVDQRFDDYQSRSAKNI
jgi:hypothetical protein